MVQYPREYFEDEYRDGFLVERTMKCAWAAQLEVLRHISEICDRHGLKYYAFFGTLLGAIRHHGYIPWDDDIDIAMMREDYQKLLEVCKSELPQEYCVLNCYDYDEWEEINVRITNGDYIDISEKRMREYYGCPFSVGVDIYPLDTIPEDEELAAQEKEILNLIAGTNQSLTQLEQETDAKEQEKWRKDTLDGLQEISEILEYQFDFEANIHSQLLQLFDQMCQVFSREEGKRVTTMANWVKGSTKIYQKSWFRYAVEFPFEYSKIMVPVGYEACLWIRFGDGYMIPRQIKASHEYPFYKEQDQLLEMNGVRENTFEFSRNIIQSLFFNSSDSSEISYMDEDYHVEVEKKSICYRVSVVEFLKAKEKVIGKIRQSIDIITQNSKLLIYFICDQEIIDTLEDEKLVNEYITLLRDMKGYCNVSVVSGENGEVIAQKADCYYGDNNSWIYYFKKLQKPFMLQNMGI